MMEQVVPFGGVGNNSFQLDAGAKCCSNISWESILSEFSIDLGDADYTSLLEEFALAEEGAESVGSLKVNSRARNIVGFIEFYVVPAVALVGMLGNLLSFVVFVGTYLRTQSSSVYLAALSVADLGFLLTVFVSKLGLSGIDLYQHNGWCQLFSYVTYVTSFLSMWFVVAFTVERYIATHFPFKRRSCTCRRATIVVIGFSLLAMMLYSFGIFTSGVTVVLGYPTCGPTQKYYKFVSIVYHVDTVITLLVPFVIILVLNVKIGYKVMRFYRRRSQNFLSDDINSDEPESPQPLSQLRISISSSAQHGFSQRQWRVTRMLLVVSTTFLLLNLPRHMTRAYTFIMALADPTYVPHGNFVLLQKIFQILYYLHFSVNIFLYSGMEEAFRRAMCYFFRRIRSKITESYNKCCILTKNRNNDLHFASRGTVRHSRTFIKLNTGSSTLERVTNL